MTSSTIARIRRIARHGLLLILGAAAMGLPLHAIPLPQAAAESSAVPARSDPRAESFAAQELSVEEILERHYEAVGGDAFQQVETMKATGTSVVMGMEAPFARYAKRPNKMLLEIYVQGMTGIQAFDGEIAWSYMPFAGQSEPQPMPAAEAQAVMEGADFDGPLVDADSKGHEVELLGIEEVSGRPAYVLGITLSTGGIQTHYVDAETFYVVRLESAEGDAVFRDYRDVGGYPVPAVIEMTGAFGEQIVYIDDVEYDVMIENGKFRMR